MPHRTCSVYGCERPVLARGWCDLHYHRWRSTGDPTKVRPQAGGRPSVPIDVRLWRKVARGGLGECWPYTGFVDKAGYARIALGGRRSGNIYVHRLAFELTFGPIPDGLVIDHLCGNRRCCNPAHLEPVTQAENVRRARERVSRGEGTQV